MPVSCTQGQHLRNYCERTAAGRNFSRQIIASCEVAGHCDIAAMDQALNAYLRRHDTFRSWFEQTADGEFVRHQTDLADMEFAPVDHGHLTVDQIHAHVVNIPSPLEGAASRSGWCRTRTASPSSPPWTTSTATRR